MVAMTSMLSSKLRRTESEQNVFETPWKAGVSSPLVLKTPIIPFPALPTPRPGCPVFITTSVLVHIASVSRGSSSSLLRQFSVSTNHASLLTRIFASLVKESPPLHVSFRGNDAAAARLSQLDADFGETDLGVTFLHGGQTPERSRVVDGNGRVLSEGRSDGLIRQASEGFVKKFADYLRVALGWVLERRKRRFSCWTDRWDAPRCGMWPKSPGILEFRCFWTARRTKSSRACWRVESWKPASGW